MDIQMILIILLSDTLALLLHVKTLISMEDLISQINCKINSAIYGGPNCKILCKISKAHEVNELNRFTSSLISSCFSFTSILLSRSCSNSSHFLSLTSARSMYSLCLLKTSSLNFNNVFAISFFKFSKFSAKSIFIF